MAERKTIYIDDATGRQIASPEDARTGGSITLRDADATRWLKENPDRSLKAAEEEAPATKERARPENKSVEKPATKGEEPKN